MPDQSRRKLRIATIVYWVLLLYIIAALVWWALMLLEQNKEIHDLRKETLNLIHTDTTTTAYKNEVYKIEDHRKRSIYKYIGEGATFLLLILVGAVYIYRSVRRQFRLHIQQQNFVMAITHELKTPIAVSRLNLETLQKYKLDEEKQHKLLNMTLQETLRLDNLINNILISSQLEGNSYRVQKEDLDFSNLVKDMIHQFSIRYPDRKIDTEIEDQAELSGDAVLLKLLLSNLLQNAHKYSPTELPITVRMSKKDSEIQLEVIDEGEGIPDAEKKHIFKKFYRIGSERTRKAQGTGLGLFICKKVVKDHDGSIDVQDNIPHGSKFIVRLPA